jgi:MFS family permease
MDNMATLRTESAVEHSPALGIRANLAQFALLVGINGLVGALVGQERTLVPLLGERVFSVRSATAALLFIATFGATKAAANLVAGILADRIGRKPVLVAGWLIGIPVPLLLMWAPAWGWVVAANLLLGVNQGLTWSTTVIMKMDLAGPLRRGLAMGFNEAAGYLAVALSAGVSGALAARYGLRPEPFLLGLAVAGVGLGLSALLIRETSGHALAEAGRALPKSLREVATIVSLRHRGLAAASRTGLINNANDAHAWGLLPILFVREGLDAAQIGLIAALYPAVWSLAQLVTGALSDRIGRRLPISFGMWVQAGALLTFALGDGLGMWASASVMLGAGTALTYPALLAAVADMAAPSWRAAAVGVYRTWRDGGYVLGALMAGMFADAIGLREALWIVAIVTALSGLDAWRNLPPSFKR